MRPKVPRDPALALQRARRRQVVTVAVFAVVLVLGLIQLITSSSDSFPLIGIALIALGAINGGIHAAELWRVIAEQRLHESNTLTGVMETGSAEAFDQTNGIVDLGHDAESSDPNEEANRARQLSSMNAAGIAYGNGTR